LKRLQSAGARVLGRNRYLSWFTQFRKELNLAEKVYKPEGSCSAACASLPTRNVPVRESISEA